MLGKALAPLYNASKLEALCKERGDIATELSTIALQKIHSTLILIVNIVGTHSQNWL